MPVSPKFQETDSTGMFDSPAAVTVNVKLKRCPVVVAGSAVTVEKVTVSGALDGTLTTTVVRPVPLRPSGGLTVAVTVRLAVAVYTCDVERPDVEAELLSPKSQETDSTKRVVAVVSAPAVTVKLKLKRWPVVVAVSGAAVAKVTVSGGLAVTLTATLAVVVWPLPSVAVTVAVYAFTEEYECVTEATLLIAPSVALSPSPNVSTAETSDELVPPFVMVNVTGWPTFCVQEGPADDVLPLARQVTVIDGAT